VAISAALPPLNGKAFDGQGILAMASEMEPANAEDSSAEVYDHQVRKPAGAGIALVASWIFFGGGQLLKGHFKRFFVLWGILVGLVGIGFLLSAFLGPDSPAREVATIVLAIALGLLWCYQVWDAFTRP